MADKKDYYESLGLNKDATETEIKKAFRQQAKKFHPDVNPGNTRARPVLRRSTKLMRFFPTPIKKPVMTNSDTPE